MLFALVERGTILDKFPTCSSGNLDSTAIHKQHDPAPNPSPFSNSTTSSGSRTYLRLIDRYKSSNLGNVQLGTIFAVQFVCMLWSPCAHTLNSCVLP